MVSRYEQCQITNARIFYTVNDATVIGRDPVTDRPIFSTPVENFIECSIEPDETEPAFRTIDGVDQVELRVSGRLVNPRVIPPEIMPAGSYRILYNFGGTIDQDEHIREGVIHILPEVQSKLKRVRAKFADRIVGMLVTTKNNYSSTLA